MIRNREQLRATLGPLKPMYTPQTLQIDTGKSRTAIFNAIGSGDLTSVLVGSRRHIPGECVADWLVREMEAGQWTGKLPGERQNRNQTKEPRQRGAYRGPELDHVPT